MTNQPGLFDNIEGREEPFEITQKNIQEVFDKLNPLFTEDRVCAICHVRTGCHQCCVKCLAAVCPRKVVVCPEYHPDDFYQCRLEVRNNPELKDFQQYFIEKPYEPR